MGGVVNPMIWLLYPQEMVMVPTVQQAGWKARVDCVKKKKSLSPTGVQPPNHQFCSPC